MQVRASHILVSSLEAAKKVLYELEHGKEFEDLAKKHSMCPSREQGGDLGFFEKGQMVKEFEDVAFSLELGKLSEPVKTEFGYHIIKITGKK